MEVLDTDTQGIRDMLDITMASRTTLATCMEPFTTSTCSTPTEARLSKLNLIKPTMYHHLEEKILVE